MLTVAIRFPKDSDLKDAVRHVVMNHLVYFLSVAFRDWLWNYAKYIVVAVWLPVPTVHVT